MNLAPSGLLVIVTGACESFTIVAQPESIEIMIAVKKNERNLFKRSPLHNKSFHPLHQILRPQMRVAFKHLQSLVPRDSRYLHRIKTLLKKPTCGLVPEIVKMKTGDPRFLTGFSEVL